MMNVIVFKLNDYSGLHVSMGGKLRQIQLSHSLRQSLHTHSNYFQTDFYTSS